MFAICVFPFLSLPENRFDLGIGASLYNAFALEKHERSEPFGPHVELPDLD